MEMTEIPTDDTRNESAANCEDETSWRMWLKKTRRKYHMQMQYFVFCAGLSLIAAGSVTIAKQDKHVSPQAFASILFAQQILIIVLKPVLGYIADSFKILKEIILVLTMFHVVAFPALYSLPPIPQGTMSLNMTEHSPSFWHDHTHWQFWLFGIVFMIMYATGNLILSLFDAACYQYVEKTGAEFGRLRMWGAIGFGLFAPITAILNYYDPNYVASYIVFFILAICMLINLTVMDMPMPQSEANILQEFRHVIKSKRFWAMEVGVVINGMGMGVVHILLIWFFEMLGGTQLTWGFLYAAQRLFGEAPFLYFASCLIKRIGYIQILTISLISYSVKFAIYSIIDNHLFLLPVELLHGLAYGIYYTAMITHANTCSKEGIEVTMQAVVAATYDGIGSGLGSLIGGLAFYYSDVHSTFLYVAIFFAIVTLMNHAIYMCNIYKRKVYTISPCINETSSTMDIRTTSFSTIPT